MNEFDEYIKDKYPSDYLLMTVRYPDQELCELYPDQFEVWQHQQAKIDELQKKYDAMHNAFTVADDCRKEWHESYMSARKERDELQERVDDHNSKLKLFINELEKTHQSDKDNKMDYWRGFSACADSSVKVFYRDVGFVELKGNKDE